MSLDPCVPRPVRKVAGTPFGKVTEGGDRAFSDLAVAGVLSVGSQVSTPALFAQEISSTTNLTILACEDLEVAAGNGNFSFADNFLLSANNAAINVVNDLNLFAGNNILLEANNVVVVGNFVVPSIETCNISCPAGNLNINSNNTFFSGNVNVADTLTVCSLACAGNLIVDASEVTINGNLTTDGLNVLAQLNVCDIHCNGDLTINANNILLNANLIELNANNILLNAADNVVINADLQVTGNLNVSDTLYTCNITCLSGNLNINSNNVSMNGNVNVANNLTANNASILNNLNANSLVVNNITVLNPNGFALNLAPLAPGRLVDYEPNTNALGYIATLPAGAISTDTQLVAFDPASSIPSRYNLSVAAPQQLVTRNPTTGNFIWSNFANLTYGNNATTLPLGISPNGNIRLANTSVVTLAAQNPVTDKLVVYNSGTETLSYANGLSAGVSGTDEFMGWDVALARPKRLPLTSSGASVNPFNMLTRDSITGSLHWSFDFPIASGQAYTLKMEPSGAIARDSNSLSSTAAYLIGLVDPTTYPNGAESIIVFDSILNAGTLVDYTPMTPVPFNVPNPFFATGSFPVLPGGAYLFVMDYSFTASLGVDSYVQLRFSLTGPATLLDNAVYRSGEDVRAGTAVIPFSSVNQFASLLPTVTLANGARTIANGPPYGGGNGLRTFVRIIQMN